MNAPVRLTVAERDLQLFAVQLLRFSAAPKVVFWHTVNEGLRSPRTGAFLKRFGMLPGVADLILCLPPTGQLAALELKSATGRLTPEQRHFRESIEMAGGKYAVANSPEVVTSTLRGWGAIDAR